MKCLRIIWIYFLLFLVIFPVVAEKESAEETIVLQVVGEAFMIDGQIAKARELRGGERFTTSGGAGGGSSCL